MLIRSRAKHDGLTVNEYGLFRGERRLAIDSEEALYRELGLDWIAPELREGLDEIELAEQHRLPRLVELADLAGTFHVHTTWSDGTATLDQMAAAARRSCGWSYLGIADHSRSAAYAGGLTPEQVARAVGGDRALEGARRATCASSAAPSATSSPTARSISTTSCCSASISWSPPSTAASRCRATR